MPFLVFRRDHLRSTSAIIYVRDHLLSNLGIIYGLGSFAALCSTKPISRRLSEHLVNIHLNFV